MGNSFSGKRNTLTLQINQTLKHRQLPSLNENLQVTVLNKDQGTHHNFA